MHHHNINHPLLRGNEVPPQANNNNNNINERDNVANDPDHHEQNLNAEADLLAPFIDNLNDGIN